MLCIRWVIKAPSTFSTYCFQQNQSAAPSAHFTHTNGCTILLTYIVQSDPGPLLELARLGSEVADWFAL